MFTRLRNFLRYRRRRKGNLLRQEIPGGGFEIEIRPPVRFRPVTLGLVERVCPYLGLEVDGVLNADIDLEKMKTPKFSDAKMALRLMLENYDDYDLESWSFNVYEHFLAVVIGNFFGRFFFP